MKNSLDRAWAMWAAVAALGDGDSAATADATARRWSRMDGSPTRRRQPEWRSGLWSPRPARTPAPPTYAAPIANASVDARVLIITADGTDAAFEAIQNTLGYLGTPYDVLNATTGPR